MSSNHDCWVLDMSISLFVECFVLDRRLVWFFSSELQVDSYKAVAPRLTQSKIEVREEINLNFMKVNRDRLCCSYEMGCFVRCSMF